ncbi:MAG: pyridoxal phosphate-dependent aminotransferase [Promethearchaeota archaeon]
MKPRISNKANKFKRSISPVRQIMSFADPNYIKNIGVNPEDLISYAGGWVNHSAPEDLRNSYKEIAEDTILFHKSGGYSPTLGNVEFKRAIIEFEKHIYGMNNLDLGQIAVGLGSTQLTMALFEALLNPGDKILLLDPSYCNYPTQIVTGVLGVEILRFPVLDNDTWEYLANSKVDKFYKFIIENKPKVVLLISPDNPTSKVLSDEFIKTALEAVKEIGGFLVIDFAYKEMVFDEEYPNYFSWGPSDNLISLRSNSKWCRGLGRRLGWIEAPQFVIESIESIQNSTILCPDMLHQMALTNYINSSIRNKTLLPYIKKINIQYKAAAEQTIKSIKSNLRFPVLEPEGGLYTCMRVDIDGAKFVEDVLKATGVLLVPGWGFGRTVKNAVRVSFGPLVNDLEKINFGFEKMARYLEK